jgi:hypothetical protein
MISSFDFVKMLYFSRNYVIADKFTNSEVYYIQYMNSLFKFNTFIAKTPPQ